MSDRPPLWRLMHGAFTDRYRQDAYWPGYAAEIRAIRDWLVPEEVEPWGKAQAERQRLRALLTAEADRAERGDQSTSESD